MMSGESGLDEHSEGHQPLQKTRWGCMIKGLVIPAILIGIFLLIAGEHETLILGDAFLDHICIICIIYV